MVNPGGLARPVWPVDLAGGAGTLRWKAGKLGGERVDDGHERGQHPPVVHADGTDGMQGNANGEHAAGRRAWLWQR